MSRRFFVAITLVSMLSMLNMMCLLSTPALAVPSLIDYKGKITNISGCVLNGEYQIQFLLYYEENGGTSLWNEQQTVIVKECLCDVQLGKVTSFPADLFKNDSLYLEMAIYNSEMNFWEVLSPRQRLTSTAYAIKATLSEQAIEAEQAYHAKSSDYALDADTVDGQHASSFLLPSGDYGRPGVASNLYEGTTTISDKYVNKGQAGSVTRPMIAGNAVDSGKIANGTIQKEDLSFPLADGYSLDAVDGYPMDAVYVSANGSVGIGTKSPKGAFAVSGDAYFSKKLALFGDKVQSDRLISANYSTSDTSSHLYGYRSEITRTGPANKNTRAVLAVSSYKSTGTTTSAAMEGVRGVTQVDAAGTLSSGSGGVFGTDIDVSGATVNLAKGITARIANLGDSTFKQAYGVESTIYNYSSYAGGNSGIMEDASLFKGFFANYDDNDKAINIYGLNLSGWGYDCQGGKKGSVDNSYGIYMDNTIDVGDNSFAIYSTSLSDSYFAGNIGIGTTSPSYQLHVMGDVGCTGNFLSPSDLRLKEHITPLENAIEKVSALRGIYFNLKDESKRQIGVIAQEVETVLPEIVSEDTQGYKSVDYSRLTPLLIEAVKELKARDEARQAQIDALEAQNEELRARIGTLEGR